METGSKRERGETEAVAAATSPETTGKVQISFASTEFYHVPTDHSPEEVYKDANGDDMIKSHYLLAL